MPKKQGNRFNIASRKRNWGKENLERLPPGLEKVREKNDTDCNCSVWPWGGQGKRKDQELRGF